MIEEKLFVENLTPWNIHIANESGIDYNQIIDKFGTKKIDDEIIKKFEEVTGKEVHYFIRRGIVFSHRDLERLLELHVEKKPFYLYSGRGPSSDGLHLGHLIPLIVTK